MLQGRLFSYGDAQRYRLGVNHSHIPVNAPKCPFHSYHRDGQMRVDGNQGGTLGYEPNSEQEWAEQPDFREPPLSIEGAADHWNHRVDEDYYSQPRALFRLMTAAQQQALFDNTARAISGASEQVKQRHIGNCTLCDPAYGAGVGRSDRPPEQIGQGKPGKEGPQAGFSCFPSTPPLPALDIDLARDARFHRIAIDLRRHTPLDGRIAQIHDEGFAADGGLPQADAFDAIDRHQGPLIAPLCRFQPAGRRRGMREAPHRVATGLVRHIRHGRIPRRRRKALLQIYCLT